MKRRLLVASYDDANGELARLEWSDGFIGEDGLMRADVLMDLLAAVTDAYNEAVDDFRHEIRVMN